MQEVYIYPVQYLGKKKESSSLEIPILVFNILCTITSIFAIYFDIVIGSIIHGIGLLYYIAFIVLFIIKYSSIIYEWVIYGIYTCQNSYSFNFKKVSIFLLIVFLIVIVPMTFVILIMSIKGATSLKQLIIDILNPYLIPHYFMIVSLILNLIFVISQDEPQNYNDEEKESKE